MNKLKPYMGHDGDANSWAILIFASTAKEAKKVFFFNNPSAENHYLDLRVKWQKDRPHLLEQADPDKLAAGISHIVDSPICCKTCEQWGPPLTDNICDDCREEKERYG